MSTNNFKFENILIVLSDFNFYHESEACNCEEKDENGICAQQGEYVDFDNGGYKDDKEFKMLIEGYRSGFLGKKLKIK